MSIDEREVWLIFGIFILEIISTYILYQMWRGDPKGASNA